MGRMLFLSMAFVLLVGCQSGNDIDFDENSTLTIKELSDDDFTVLKKVEEESEVESFVKFFKRLDWETNVDVDFADEPDYKLNEYGIWLTPEEDRLEINSFDSGNYASLSEKESDVLLNMLTEKNVEKDN